MEGLGFLEKIFGKDLVTKLKAEAEKVKAAWEEHTKLVQANHKEVMAELAEIKKHLPPRKDSGTP